MKFGDLIRNEYASDMNPHKILMVIGVCDSLVYCLTIKGKRVSFRNDTDLKLTPVGRVDFSEWAELAKKQRHGD